MPPKKSHRNLISHNKEQHLNLINQNNAIIREQNIELKKQHIELMNNNATILTNKEKINSLLQIISEQDIELDRLNCKTKKNRETMRNKSQNVIRKNAKLNELDKELHEVGNIKKVAFQLTNSTALKRRRKPSRPDSLESQMKVRRSEMYCATKNIHGAEKNNLDPILHGTIDFLSAKFSTSSLCDKILSSRPTLVKAIRNRVLSDHTTSYYKSKDNELRSISMYYSSGVMGKAKYVDVLRANRKASSQYVPNFIPYKKLAYLINHTEIGKLYDVNELLQGSEIEKGCYRQCDEYLVALAKFYLNVNEHRSDKLLEFGHFPKKNQDSFLFACTFGGDGAPICGTSFLATFLNVGKRIPSSSETFLLFGSDAAEDSLVSRKFVTKAISDFMYLESKVFDVVLNNGSLRKVEFKLCELPNDMKMLACLAGELTNSAHFFTTFASVHKDNCRVRHNTFGNEKHNEWKPFPYQKRVSDANNVALLKSKLQDKASKKLKLQEKKGTEAEVSRGSILKYIRSTLNSRQEFKPLVREFIDRAKPEPLHIKNNVVANTFKVILKLAAGNNDSQNVKSYQFLPLESLFARFVTCVCNDMHCHLLSKHIIKWFNEERNSKSDKDFSFRFRGKESFLFLKHFPKLIKLVFDSMDSDKCRVTLLQIHYKSILLRKVISYALRINSFTEEILEELTTDCSLLFQACCTFDMAITPSMWVLCNIVPFSAKQTLHEYGLGLGCNTMEGREQKHQCLAKYSRNTTFQNRWPNIFRHEHNILVYIRLNGFDRNNYVQRKRSYIPEPSPTTCSKCGFHLSAGESLCGLCGHSLMQKLIQNTEVH